MSKKYLLSCTSCLINCFHISGCQSCNYIQHDRCSVLRLSGKTWKCLLKIIYFTATFFPCLAKTSSCSTMKYAYGTMTVKDCKKVINLWQEIAGDWQEYVQNQIIKNEMTMKITMTGKINFHIVWPVTLYKLHTRQYFRRIIYKLISRKRIMKGPDQFFIHIIININWENIEKTVQQYYYFLRLLYF